MRLLIPSHDVRTSLALLVLRVVVGLSLIQHGAPKMHDPLHWLDHGPLPGTPPFLQLIVALAEYAGGFALIAGVLTPLFALLLTGDMLVIVFVVMIPHGVPFVGSGHSYEVPAFILACVLALLLAGPGRFSADALVAGRERRTSLDWRSIR
ncbi:MAG TPA: DoxX family protein [Candidatus Limnocylindria bacterium]|nr:DoxX family protein [Candidatus Limnocylindria bacterium]